MLTTTLTLALLLSLAPPTDAPAAPPTSSDKSDKHALRLAVYPLKAEGVDAKLAALATDGVATEIRKLQRVSVVAMDEIKAMLDLEAQKQLLGCSDESCLAEIADSLGVDGVVIGTVASVGGQTVFGLKRIDQRGAKVVGSATKRVPDNDGEAVLAAIGPVVAELFPDIPLRAGAVRGVDESLARRLSPPPIPVWAFGTAAAATGALALATIGVGAFNLYLTDDYAKTLSASTSTPVAGKEIVTKEQSIATSGIVTYAALAATVLAGAGLGVMGLFTDWYDDAHAAQVHR